MPPTNACRKELDALKALLPSPPPTPRLDLLCARPRVGVGAVLLCAAHPGAVLVGERRGSHGAGRWALPGGHLEAGASFAGCASAELLEETGLRVGEARLALCGATNDPMPEEDLHYVTLFVCGRVTAEEAAGVVNCEADKCAGWAWVAWERLGGEGGLPVFAPLRRFIADGGPERAERTAPPLQS